MICVQPLPHKGTQTVGANQAITHHLQPGRSLRDRHRDAVFPRGKADGGRSGLKLYAVLIRGRVQERALQIGAMRDKIGRAPARFGASERHESKSGAIPGPADSNCLRGKRVGREALQYAEPSQNHAGIGRELEPCPTLFEDLRLFVKVTRQPARARQKDVQSPPMPDPAITACGGVILAVAAAQP